MNVGSITFNATASGDHILTGGSLNLGVGIIAVNASSATIASTVTGNAGLSKNGTGVLILTGNNSYTGDTKINAGTLEIAGGIAVSGTSLIDIQSGKAVLKTVNVNKTSLNINTAALATFEVVNGVHTVGAIMGSGITQVDNGANLSVASILQNTLNVGSGATVTIRPIAGGPLGDTIAPVPEPSNCALLSIGAISLLAYAWRRLSGTA